MYVASEPRPLKTSLLRCIGSESGLRKSYSRPRPRWPIGSLVPGDSSVEALDRRNAPVASFRSETLEVPDFF